MTASKENATPSPRYLETSHIAHRLSTSQEFVRQLIRKHKLPAIRVGAHYRIEPLEFEAYLQRCRTIQRIRSILSTGGSA